MDQHLRSPGGVILTHTHIVQCTLRLSSATKHCEHLSIPENQANAVVSEQSQYKPSYWCVALLADTIPSFTCGLRQALAQFFLRAASFGLFICGAGDRPMGCDGQAAAPGSLRRSAEVRWSLPRCAEVSRAKRGRNRAVGNGIQQGTPKTNHPYKWPG